MKKAGKINGIQVYTDPTVPPNTLFMINDKADYSTAVAYYQHIYKTTFSLDNDAPRVHACFERGHWCWLQLRTHPLQSIKQIIGRLR